MNYIVKALSVSGLGNKIFKSKDKNGKPTIVTEKDFPEGTVAGFVANGHLEEIKEKSSKKPAKSTDKGAADKGDADKEPTSKSK